MRKLLRSVYPYCIISKVCIEGTIDVKVLMYIDWSAHNLHTHMQMESRQKRYRSACQTMPNTTHLPYNLQYTPTVLQIICHPISHAITSTDGLTEHRSSLIKTSSWDCETVKHARNILLKAHFPQLHGVRTPFQGLDLGCYLVKASISLWHC